MWGMRVIKYVQLTSDENESERKEKISARYCSTSQNSVS